MIVSYIDVSRYHEDDGDERKHYEIKCNKCDCSHFDTISDIDEYIDGYLLTTLKLKCINCDNIEHAQEIGLRIEQY